MHHHPETHHSHHEYPHIYRTMDQQTYSPKQPPALRAIIRLAHGRTVVIATEEGTRQLPRAIHTRIMYLKTGLRVMNEPVSIHNFKVQTPFAVKYKRKPTFFVSDHPFALVTVTSAAEKNFETISVQQTQVSN